MKESTTIDEFFESEENLAIHCRTKKQAIALLKAFDDNDYTWSDGDDYTGETYWNEYKENTCYSNKRGYGDMEYYKYSKYKYRIIEFEDFKKQLAEERKKLYSNLEYGKWYPISVYYENQDKLDWALVQFKETKTGFMPLPYRAEYIKSYGVWATQTEADRYLCELCEPIAFMLWQPYEEVK